MHKALASWCSQGFALIDNANFHVKIIILHSVVENEPLVYEPEEGEMQYISFSLGT